MRADTKTPRKESQNALLNEARKEPILPSFKLSDAEVGDFLRAGKKALFFPIDNHLLLFFALRSVSFCCGK
jgi:hypothetical protein